MNFKLEQEFSKADVIQQVDDLKKQIDGMRPLPADVEGRVMQKLRLDWNYHSNAIEGNRLSYGETIAFLMEGITAKGKPLKDHLDIRGHNEAINFLLSIVKDTRPVTETDIRALHKMTLVEEYDVNASTPDGLPTTKRIMLGEYKTSPNHVKTATGEIHYYATPEETPAKMQELMEWYTEAIEQQNIHPLVIAALFHHKFVSIHPFDDGNGRMSRILMNLILMQKGYPPVIVKLDDRINYYALLNRADRGDNWPFVEYIGENMFKSIQLFLKAINGGDIDEEDDVDKEIALFKIEIQNDIQLKEKRTSVMIDTVFGRDLLTLFLKLISKVKKFDDLFFEPKYYLTLKRKVDDAIDTKYFNVTELDRSQIIGYFIDNSNNVLGVGLDLDLCEFRNIEKHFDVMSKLYVDFDEYDYKIFSNVSDASVIKMYHENITKEETQNIIYAFVNGIKSIITNRLKQKD